MRLALLPRRHSETLRENVCYDETKASVWAGHRSAWFLRDDATKEKTRGKKPPFAANKKGRDY